MDSFMLCLPGQTLQHCRYGYPRCERFLQSLAITFHLFHLSYCPLVLHVCTAENSQTSSSDIRDLHTLMTPPHPPSYPRSTSSLSFSSRNDSPSPLESWWFWTGHDSLNWLHFHSGEHRTAHNTSHGTSPVLGRHQESPSPDWSQHFSPVLT